MLRGTTFIHRHQLPASVRVKGRAPPGYFCVCASLHPTASKATFAPQGSGRPSSQRTALSWEIQELLLFLIGVTIIAYIPAIVNLPRTENRLFNADHVTIHPSSRLARIRTGVQCSPYRPVASTARRHGGSRARVDGSETNGILTIKFHLLYNCFVASMAYKGTGGWMV